MFAMANGMRERPNIPLGVLRLVDDGGHYHGAGLTYSVVLLVRYARTVP